MAILIRPATSRYDDAVRDLFTEADLPIRREYWERTFTPSGAAAPSKAWVAFDSATELVVAFAAVKPIELVVESGRTDAQILHDVVAAPWAARSEAPLLLLRDIIRHAPLTIMAGAGLEASRLLAEMSFLKTGFFQRAVCTPDSEPVVESEALPLRRVESLPRLGALNDAMEERRRIFRPRSSAERDWYFTGPAKGVEILSGDATPSGCPAYAVLRREDGRGEDNDLLVADWACAPEDLSAFAMALGQVGRDRALDLYVTAFGGLWQQPFEKAGFRFLRPRWPLHWILRDGRQEILGKVLAREELWFFTPADGEADQW